MNEMEKVLTNIGEKTLEEVISLIKPQFEQYAKDAVSLANEALGMRFDLDNKTRSGSQEDSCLKPAELEADKLARYSSHSNLIE